MAASAVTILIAVLLFGDNIERHNGPLSPLIVTLLIGYAVALWQTASAIALERTATPTMESRIGYTLLLIYPFLGAWVLRKRLRA